MKAYRNIVRTHSNVSFICLFLLSFGFGLGTTGFLFPIESLAATFTVTPTSDADCSDFNCILQSALDASEKNGQSDTINIAAGTYSTADNSDTAFLYTPSSESFPLVLAGAGVGKTILDGGSNTQVFFINTTNLSNDSNADITVRNLTVQNGKFADGFGGGLCVFTVSADVTIENSKFINNSAAGGGGGDVLTDTGNITLRKNEFRDNIADFLGGGASLEAAFGGEIRLTGNIFTNNLVDDPSSDVGGFGGGADIFTSFSGDITLIDNIFMDNEADAFDGGTSGGGASILAVLGGNVTLTNNSFIRNLADFNRGDTFGGGASVETDTGDIILTNNTFIRNVSEVTNGESSGGGASVETDLGAITLTNNTFTLNSTSGDGGGLNARTFSENSTINIYNNISFNNTATRNGDDIFIQESVDNSTVSLVNLFNNDFSDCFSSRANTACANAPNIMQGSNINQDPLFVDARNGDVHLRPGSPAIDAGNPDAPALPATDFEGTPRNIDGDENGTPLPDIGADELIPPCRGLPATIVGTEDDDALTGTSGPDVIHGLGGNDTIIGLGGNDLICGGGGDDELRGGPGDDELRGGPEDDALTGGAGTDVCRGGSQVTRDTAVNCETVINIP